MKKKKERKLAILPVICELLMTTSAVVNTNLRNKSMNHTQQFYKYLIKLHKSYIGNQIYQPLSAAS